MDAIKEMIKAIILAVDKKIATAKFDRTVRGRITDVLPNNKYKVKINGIDYIVKSKIPHKINDVVNVVIPLNNYKNMFIVSEKAQTQGGILDDSSYELRLAKIQYIDFDSSYWGSTNEEKARNIAKFDIHVSGGISESVLPIINRARQLNPNLKLCYYISVASGRPWFSDGWYTFRRGCVWDDDWATAQSEARNTSMTRPSTKWEIFQEIEKAHHVGGTKTGNLIFIETYTWVDEDSVVHSDDKYIEEYTGGVSYDGLFWDDVGFDTNITDGLFYDSDNSSEAIESIKRQGFNSRRDKYICINQFARDRGMFVIPNSVNKDDLFDPAISDSNPDGLGSSLTSDDFVFVESCLTMSDTFNTVRWRNEVPRVVEYLRDWYDIVGAKVICEDYMCGGMDKTLRNYLITFMMATYVSVGVHYFALTDTDVIRPSNDIHIPDILSLPVPLDNETRSIHLTNPAPNLYKYDYSSASLSVSRQTSVTNGVVDMYGVLHGTSIILNGSPIIDAFITSAVAHAELKESIDTLTNNVTDVLSDTKRSASRYNRLMIDDWSTQDLVYTNLLTDENFTTWAEASNTKNIVNGAVTTYDATARSLQWSLPDIEQYYQTEYLQIKIYPEQYGHTIELGFKLTTQGNEISAWNNIWLDGELMDVVGANPPSGTSTLYPERTDIYVETYAIPDYGEREYVELQILGSWNNNAISATFDAMYVIDKNEFEDDITKDSYTNLLPVPTTNGGYSDPHLVTLTGDANSFEAVLPAEVVVGEETKTFIDGNGPSWWVNTSSILKPGHTYEIGITDYTAVNGSLSFNFDVNTDSGIVCGFIPTDRKVNSKVLATTSYNKVFSLAEDAVLGTSLLYIRYFLSIGETEPVGFTIFGWYLYDIDEENVVIRGLSPSNTSIMIARVMDENFQTDVTNGTLIRNTLYITETGKMYITDINANVINLIA